MDCCKKFLRGFSKKGFLKRGSIKRGRVFFYCSEEVEAKPSVDWPLQWMKKSFSIFMVT
jgi:hypothetical protein